MPILEPKPYERQDKYLQRCIPVEVEAGKSRAQATAICIAKYKEK